MTAIDAGVYYLELLAHARRSVPAPRDGLTVAHAQKPTVAYYRFLYDTIGRDYHWHSRGKLADADLDAVLDNPRNEVHVLFVDSTPAGFTELDRRTGREIELVQVRPDAWVHRPGAGQVVPAMDD